MKHIHHLKQYRKQKGFTLVEILVVVGILLALGFAAQTYIAGSQQRNEWNDAAKLATVDIASVLQSEMSERRSYARLAATAAGKALITGAGVTPTTPWGSVWDIGVAGTATAVTLDFPCAGAADPARWCTEVSTRITNAASPMITSAAVTGTGATAEVRVVYRRPLVN